MFLNIKRISHLIKSAQLINYIKNGMLKRYFIHNIIKNFFIGRYLRAYHIYKVIKKNNLLVYKLRDLTASLKIFYNINKIVIKVIFIKDKDIIRIIEAYNKAKNDQKNQPITYQIGGIWKRKLKESFGNLISAFKKKNMKQIKKILENFSNEKFSIGLCISGGVPRNFIEKLERLNTLNLNYFYWKKLTNLGENPTEYVKEIGNLFGIMKKEKVIPTNSFRLSYYAKRITELITSTINSNIVEIGGSYGGVPYHIFNEHKCNITYLDFDIPEVCILASFFLMSNFPNKRFLLYGEKNINDIDFSDYDIIIMPNYVIKDLPDNCYDLVFNSHSLTEMDPMTVKEYLYQIERITLNYFLHFNHEYGREYITLDGKYKKQVCLNTPEFELPRNKFRKVYQIPEKINRITLLKNYREYGFFEYLYQKNN